MENILVLHGHVIVMFMFIIFCGPIFCEACMPSYTDMFFFFLLLLLFFFFLFVCFFFFFFFFFVFLSHGK